MLRVFGLSRDPFLKAYDEALYWEPPERAVARRVAVEALELGQSVLVSGPPGAGRAAFLERLAGEVALTGRSILWAPVPSEASRAEFLAELLRAISETPVAEDLEELAGALYERLVEAFARSGTLVCFPGGEPLEEAAAVEAGILSRLRIARTPVVALALCGGAEAAIRPEEAVTLRLQPFGPAQLRACLVHRASACGAPELLSPQALDEISDQATGIGEAIELARREVLRRLFRGAESVEAAAHCCIFDPEELEEVGRLLDALAPVQSEPALG